MKGGLTIWDETLKQHVDVSKPKQATGSLQNINDAVTLELGGRGSVGIVVTQPGGYNGTALVEASLDGGVTWFGLTFENLVPLDAALSTGSAIDTTLLASGFAWLSLGPVGGATHMRVWEAVGSGGAALQVVLTATYGPGRKVPERTFGYGAAADSVQALPRMAVGRGGITTSEAAYAAGDVIGGEIQIGSSAANAVPAVLRSVVLKDDKNQKPALQILFFRSDPASTYTDNSPVAPSTTDMQAIVGMVSIAAADWVTIQGTAKAVVTRELDLPIGPQQTAFWMVLVVGPGSAPDYAAGSTDLRYEIAFQHAGL